MELLRIGCENSSYSLLHIYLLPGTMLALRSHVLFAAHYTPRRWGVTSTLQRRTSRLKKVHCLLRPHSLSARTVTALLVPVTGQAQQDTESLLMACPCPLEPKKASFMGFWESGFPFEKGEISFGTSSLKRWPAFLFFS